MIRRCGQVAGLTPAALYVYSYAATHPQLERYDAAVPNKTIYVSDGDLKVFQRAQELAGGNLSAAIANALRRYVDVQEGLKEGFAEFFRAYCGAFVAWLATPRGAGPSWLDGALRELRASALKGKKAPPAELNAILRGITSLTLGESLDPELDLEAQFQAWLAARR